MVFNARAAHKIYILTYFKTFTTRLIAFLKVISSLLTVVYAGCPCENNGFVSFPQAELCNRWLNMYICFIF